MSGLCVCRESLKPWYKRSGRDCDLERNRKAGVLGRQAERGDRGREKGKRKEKIRATCGNLISSWVRYVSPGGILFVQ